MGTNFYVEYDRTEGTSFYGESVVRYKIVHLGKASYGLRFLFQEITIREYYMMSRTGSLILNSHKAWKEFVIDGGGNIVDEYGKPYTWEQFNDLVYGKSLGRRHKSEPYHVIKIDDDGYEFCAGDWS